MPPTYPFIGEAEALRIQPGSAVELARGGHITPLAQETLRARRVTVVRAGSADPHLPQDLAPPATIARVAIGADHTGVALKAAIVSHLRKAGVAVVDHGTHASDAVDYPDIAAAVGRAVVRGEADAGVVIDGSGLGSAMAANKIKGVRAAMCQNVTLARYAREHIGANVLTLGSTLVSPAEGIAILDAWRSTPMREARYIRRLLKVRRLEGDF